MKEYTIKLDELVNPPQTDSISGREVGKSFAIKKDLFNHINDTEKIVLEIDYNNVKAINDSFIKGFFNEVFKKYKTKDFINKHFEIRSNDYFKTLFDKNWSILEGVYK